MSASAASLLHADRLRRFGPDVFIIFMLVLWMVYCVNGFRPPTQPITLSDSDSGSGVRQLVFAGSGMLAVRRLLITGSLSQVLGLRMPIFALALFMILSATWSFSLVTSVKRSLIFLFGLLALTAATHMVKRPVLLAQRVLVFTCGAIAWLSIVFHFVLPKNCTVNPARDGLSGISNHPNTLAPLLVIGFALSLGVTVYGRERILLRISQVGQMLGAVMTESMTSMSLLLTSIGLFLILSVRSYYRGSMQIAIFSVVFLVNLVGVQTVRDEMLNSIGRDASLSGRDQLWAAVAHEVGKKPIFGHGYGGFWYEGRGREMVKTWNPRQAHNAYLDVMADLGLTGLFLVLVLFHGGLISGWRRYKGPETSAQRRAVASMVGSCLGILFVYAFGQSFVFKLDSFPFFAFLWCLLLLTNQDRNNIRTEFETAAEERKLIEAREGAILQGAPG
jgi:O-antigen ligase